MGKLVINGNVVKANAPGQRYQVVHYSKRVGKDEKGKDVYKDVYSDLMTVPSRSRLDLVEGLDYWVYRTSSKMEARRVKEGKSWFCRSSSPVTYYAKAGVVTFIMVNKGSKLDIGLDKFDKEVLGLKMETPNPKKVMKYLKRIMAPHKAMIKLGADDYTYRVHSSENPTLLRVLEGMSFIRGAFVRGKLGMDVPEGTLLMLTWVNQDFFHKSYALVRDDLEVDISTYEVKKDIRATDASHSFVGVINISGGKEKVWTDEQSTTNFKLHGFLEEWGYDYLHEYQENMEDPEFIKEQLSFYSAMDKNGELRYEFNLLKAFHSTENPLRFQVFKRAAASLFLTRIMNLFLGRIPIPEGVAVSRYLFPDPSAFDEFGEFIGRGVLGPDECHIGNTYAGSDVAFYRNPNAEGEWDVREAVPSSILEPLNGGALFYGMDDVEYAAEMLDRLGGGDNDDRVVVFIDEYTVAHFTGVGVMSGLPQMEESDRIKAAGSAKNTQAILVDERVKWQMALSFMSMEDVLGVVVNAYISVVAKADYGEKSDFYGLDLEGIVDDIVQNGADLSDDPRVTELLKHLLNMKEYARYTYRRLGDEIRGLINESEDYVLVDTEYDEVLETLWQKLQSILQEIYRGQLDTPVDFRVSEINVPDYLQEEAKELRRIYGAAFAGLSDRKSLFKAMISRKDPESEMSIAYAKVSREISDRLARFSTQEQMGIYIHLYEMVYNTNELKTEVVVGILTGQRGYPDGIMMVPGYTKADGTEVRGLRDLFYELLGLLGDNCYWKTVKFNKGMFERYRNAVAVVKVNHNTVTDLASGLVIGKASAPNGTHSLEHGRLRVKFTRKAGVTLDDKLTVKIVNGWKSRIADGEVSEKDATQWRNSLLGQVVELKYTTFNEMLAVEVHLGGTRVGYVAKSNLPQLVAQGNPRYFKVTGNVGNYTMVATVEPVGNPAPSNGGGNSQTGNGPKKATKVAVVGSRNFLDYATFKKAMDRIVSKYDNVSLVSGGAKGADKMAETFAKSKGIDVTVYRPKWRNNGAYDPAAGMKRNPLIIADSDLVLAFWDLKSKGTMDSVFLAYASKVPGWVYDFETGKWYNIEQVGKAFGWDTDDFEGATLNALERLKAVGTK